ncbi:hypothetical protein MPTK1_5g08440 [Marchantia polymorpha subsp. ruderalis]|uniref:Peptidase S54 rhomboid domain-containing protein n=2 Tax=Marchantia polymorpha TaxID=3197 RepID=A0AAF6BG92_MARPO|nr:hypothetical protein MARPO_0086s0048 [Marchantia polymorpha]BBN11026.1 hypothetical protein Mp_5g08440 [Marchantia polymorpha subsp. ruderalis]|eukprot:PTQ33724.1 hypothetical protein MARPO_0086s0048 [Marchantia polymorpha]
MGFCIAARSSKDNILCLLRRSGDLARHLRTPYSHFPNSSTPLTRSGIVAPRCSGLSPFYSISFASTSVVNQTKASGIIFRRSMWGSRMESTKNTMKELEWMRPRGRIVGPFGGSGIRHFGGGGYAGPELALGLLIGANVGIFFLWRILSPTFMQSNFVASAAALRSGRLHTLVTSAFSQYELHHLLSNMIGLYFFGNEIARIFGGQKLILLYLTGGVVGSLSHMAYWAYLKPWFEGYPSRRTQYSPGLLGSSGAVNAIMLLDILLFPKRIIYFNMILPIPAALFGLVIIGSDLWAATDGNKHGTSPAAHLGGAVTGFIAFLKWRL